jgi:FKBP-type peptidyl-prolyl cis-trans isomerase 2
VKIARGLSVLIEYELKVKAGDVIESSAKNGPIRYVQGEGRMLPGLEQRLEGLSPGDERAGEIPAREAFGTGSRCQSRRSTARTFRATPSRPSERSSKHGAAVAPRRWLSRWWR